MEDTLEAISTETPLGLIEDHAPVAEADPRDLRISELEDSYRVLMDRLREALAATEPGLRVELINGDSLVEIEAGYASARALLREVREGLRRELAGAAVPAGAPGRNSAQQPRSPLDKIRSGLGRLQL